MLLITATAASVAACGSSDNDSSGNAAAATGSTTTASAGDKAKYAAEIEQLLKRPTSIGITEPVKPPPGKNIAFIQCGYPDCVQIGKAFVEAATKVGWKVSTIQAGNAPETVKKAWADAVQRSPDAIGQVGGPPMEYYADERAAAIKKGIPLFGIAETLPGKPWTASIGNGEGSVKEIPVNAAKFVASKIDGGTVLAVDVIGIPLINKMAASFKASLPQLCSGCKIKSLDIPAASLGKDSTSRIANEVRANPGLKYAWLPTIDFALGLDAAYKGVGVTAPPTVTGTQSAAGLAALTKGEAGLQGTVYYAGIEAAWRVVDAMARTFNHQSLAPDSDKSIPAWILTPTNIPAGEDPLPAVKDYKAQFSKLWGVG